MAKTATAPITNKSGRIIVLKDGVELYEDKPGVYMTRIDTDELKDCFDPKRNVRDANNFIEAWDLVQFAERLAADGFIKTPVALAVPKDLGLEEKDLPTLSLKDLLKKSEGIEGNRRVWASYLMKHNKLPEQIIGSEKMDYTIPVQVYWNLDRIEMLNLKIDQDTQKGLNEYEVMLAIRQHSQSGSPLSHKERMWRMKGFFYNMTSISQRTEYDAMMKGLKSSSEEDKKTAVQKFYRGRYQKLQRIAESPHDELRENLRQQVLRNKFVPITSAEMVKLYDMPREEFVEAWKQKNAEKVASDNGDSGGEKTLKFTMKILEEKRAFLGVGPFKVLLDAIFGDAAAQEKLGRVRDEMVKIGAALEEDAEKFWANTDKLAKARLDRFKQQS